MAKASELKEIIKYVIHNNQLLEERGRKKTTLEIEGESGIGKTSIVLQVARELGMDYSKYNPSQTDDAGDITGMPLREFECKDGDETLWVNEKTIDRLPSHVHFTGHTRTVTCRPSWVPNKPNSILLIDDWNRSHPHIIQALMEIIDRGESVGWKLPENTHVILSSNPDNGNYFVTSIDNAQKTRSTKVNLDFDVKEWAKWAEENEVDSRCINFLLLNPEMINIEAGINARLATTFFDTLISLSSFDKENFGLIHLLGEGSVGQEFTATFITFINNKLDRLPSPHFILDLDEKPENVIKAIKSVCGDKGTADYKASIASVINTRITNYALKLADEKKLNKKEHVKRIIDIIFSDTLDKDLTFMMIKTLNARKEFSYLLSEPRIFNEVLS